MRRAWPALILAAGAVLCRGAWGLRDLGFYHDDWLVLEILHFSPAGFAGQLRALMGAMAFQWHRPLDLPVWAFLYNASGSDPLGWQTALLASHFLSALLVYGLLRDFKTDQRISLLGALFFLAYPNKDATIFWPIAIVGSLSLCAWLWAYRAHLRYARAGGAHRLMLSLLGLVCAPLLYDQCLFLPLLWLVTPDVIEEGMNRRQKLSTSAAWMLLALTLGYKLIFVPRVLGAPSGKALGFSLRHCGWVALAGLNASFGPKLIAASLAGARRAFAFSPLLGLAAFALPWAARPSGEDDPARRKPLFLLGVGIFILGYLPLALSDYNPTPVNHQNRLNLVPCLGLALAAAAWASARPRARAQWLGVLASLSLAATLGFSRSWAESYRRQEAVRDALQRRPDLWPADQLLLLRLPERYVDGKAPVFDAPWDFRAAARLWLNDPNRHANVVSPRMKFSETGAFEPGEGTTPYSAIRLLDAASGAIAPLDYSRAREF